MKTLIATTAFALSLSAPAFAKVTDAQVYLAQYNDSAREQIVRTVAEVPSRGPVSAATIEAAEKLTHESGLEGKIFFGGNVQAVDASGLTAGDRFKMMVDAETDGL